MQCYATHNHYNCIKVLVLLMNFHMQLGFICFYKKIKILDITVDIKTFTTKRDANLIKILPLH